MKQEDAKRAILQEWRNLQEDQRTETAAVSLSLSHAHVNSPFAFKCSGDPYQVIMGWLEPHISPKKLI